MKIIIIAVLFIATITSYQLARYFGILFPAQTQITQQQSPTDSISQREETVRPTPPVVKEIARGLTVPWSIVFTAPQRILIAERLGRIQVIENNILLPTPLHQFSEITSRSEEGLMGMTIDPAYEQNKHLYVCYALASNGQYINRVVRFVDQGTSLQEETLLLDKIPAATNHAGCRLKFGPDAKLYISTGDATKKEIAQDPASLGGKILRINPDGSIPEDNPFPGSTIYSLGHRNIQGFAWHPKFSTLIATEHGPSIFDGPAGGDEINFIQKGKNYGWPIVSHERKKEGLIDPLLVFTPAIAPAGAAFYTGDQFPQWKNHFFFALLRGEGIMEVIFDATGEKPVSFTRAQWAQGYGRIRDVTTGPDGAIYFVTSNTDGRGKARDGDDKLYRVSVSSSL